MVFKEAMETLVGRLMTQDLDQSTDGEPAEPAEATRSRNKNGGADKELRDPLRESLIDGAEESPE